MHSCVVCMDFRDTAEGLRRHMREEHCQATNYQGTLNAQECDICGIVFFNSDAYQKHRYSHQYPTYSCFRCKNRFSSQIQQRDHIKDCQVATRPLHLQSGGSNAFVEKSALNGGAIEHRAVISDTVSATDSLSLANDLITQSAKAILLKTAESSIHPRKFVVSTFVNFHQASDGEITDPPAVFRSEPVTLYSLTEEVDLDYQLTTIYNNILLKMNTFTRNGSGWILNRILAIDLSITVYDPLRAGSYLELPPSKRNSRSGYLNIKNADQKCLLWCLIAHKKWRDNGDRLPGHPCEMRHYQRFENAYFNLKGIAFPVQPRDIGKVEKRTDRAINVFRLSEDSQIYPARLSKRAVTNESHQRIDLLELTDGAQNHYVLITHLERTICRQYSLSHIPKIVCRRCLFVTHTESVYERHKELCGQHNVQRVTLPKANCARLSDKFRYLKDVPNQHTSRVRGQESLLPFVIYADIGSAYFNYHNIKCDSICHTISDLAPKLLFDKQRPLSLTFSIHACVITRLHFLFMYVLSLACIPIQKSAIKLKSFRKHLSY